MLLPVFFYVVGGECRKVWWRRRNCNW